MKTKTCSKCKQVKELACFSNYKYKGENKKRPNCKECQNKMTLDWRNRNREHISNYNKKQYWKDPESKRTAAISEYYKNIKKNRRKAREYASNPKNKTRRSKNFKEFVKNNPDYYRNYYKRNADIYREHQARRRQKKHASSLNLTKQQIQQMRDMYWFAKDLTCVSGEVYEVDHIVPIKGENFCGLHVPWNLQILPRDLNRAKGNKYSGADTFL